MGFQAAAYRRLDDPQQGSSQPLPWCEPVEPPKQDFNQWGVLQRRDDLGDPACYEWHVQVRADLKAIRQW